MSAQGLGSRAIIGSFYARLEAANRGWVDQLAFRVDSNQESETLKWLGQAPQLREWVGGRQAKGFRENGLTIVNKTFEGTLEVLLDEIRRDKTGQVMVRVNELADRAADHDAELLSTLINNGAASVCYDGQYFFDTDHTEGDNTTNQSNAIAVDISDEGTGGTATAPTARTMQVAILKAVSAILSFKDDRNQPMNQGAARFLVMVPPGVGFMPSAMAAIANPTLDSGMTNTIRAQSQFQIEAVVNPRLTWTDKFAVFRTDGAVKPLIRQVEQDIAMDAVAEGSEYEFLHRKHLYGVTKVGNVAYGYWQHACQVTLQA